MYHQSAALKTHSTSDTQTLFYTLDDTAEVHRQPLASLHDKGFDSFNIINLNNDSGSKASLPPVESDGMLIAAPSEGIMEFLISLTDLNYTCPLQNLLYQHLGQLLFLDTFFFLLFQ